MKRPNQAILMQKQFHKMIDDGTKRITIREGYRDYAPGFTLLCCHIDSWCKAVNVIAVEHTTISYVRHIDLEADGFIDREHLLEGMRHFYPDINYDSPVTVVRWIPKA